MDARGLLEIAAEYVNAEQLNQDREHYGLPDQRDEIADRFAAALDDYLAERVPL